MEGLGFNETNQIWCAVLVRLAFRDESALDLVSSALGLSDSAAKYKYTP